MALVLPNNSISNGNGNELEHQTFHNYFENWLHEQNKDLNSLISAADAAAAAEDNDGGGGGGDSVMSLRLRPLIDTVIRHYEEYYKAKSRWAKVEVLSLFSPSWRSSLEDAFLWIGGWRPTMAFHLLYSKSGLQLEAKFADLIRGLSGGACDLGDLSPSQLIKIDRLQRQTVGEEKKIGEKFAELQETVADKSMVELSNVLSEAARNSGGEEAEEINESTGRVKATVQEKEEGLEEILNKADSLRLTTLKEVVIGVLTPIQAVHFLIAAAELHLQLHDWGMKRDSAMGAAAAHHTNGFNDRNNPGY